MRHLEILQKEPSRAPDVGKFASYTAGEIFPTLFSLSVATEAR